MKPHIICHMVSSVDGKIGGAALSSVMVDAANGKTNEIRQQENDECDELQ